MSEPEHVPSGWFVVRAPYLSLDERIAAPARTVEAAMKRPDVRDAIHLASPGLLEQWNRRCERTAADRHRSMLAIRRYLDRMATRCTPFGLFAGWSLGSLGSATRIELGPRSAIRRHTRLDHDYVFRLADAVASSPEGRGVLQFRPNPTLYPVSGRWRWVEARELDGVRHHVLGSAVDGPALEAAVRAAAGGATLAHIADDIAAEDPALERADIDAFVHRLVDAQILEPETTLTVTGADAFAALTRTLAPHSCLAGTVHRMRRTRRQLRDIDAAGAGVEPVRYHCLAETLPPLAAKLDRTRLIQVDFQRAAAHATLGPDVVDAVHVGIRALRAFESDTAETSLTRFRDAFVHRWEMRAVPLLEALDPDRGLSFPLDAEHLHAPLLRGLGIEGSAGARSLPWRKQEQWLLERLHEAWSSGGRELRFSPADIPEANRRRPPLPDAFHAFVELLGRPDGRPVVHLKSVGGPSGARLFGRFCAMDRTLTRRVREHLALEEAARPDVVFAEIAHLPEGRIGNIACRPLLRAHEIPILGRSGAPAKRCIPLQDLLLSVRDGRLVLTSRRFGKEIAPRLTNAHNVSHRSVPVYRLLAALGLQNVDAWLGWSWGPFSTAPFLPRVVVDGVILERATWNVPRPKWMGSGVSVVDAEEVTAFRAQRGMPRHVALVQDDNELPVDFDDPDSVAALQVATHKLDRMTLAEFLPAEFEPLVRGPEGGYAGEIVLPFHRVRQNVTPDLHDAERRQAADTRTLGSRSSTVPVLHARTFAPASEWLYARIYCGGVAADRVLSALHPKIAQARDAALVRRWFFIRYGEDGWHLRLRFLGEPDALSARLLPVLGAVVDPLLRQGVVHRMAIDTYEREVERYGGPAGIEACEQIFEADSDAVMDLLPCMLGDDGADRRWQWTLLSVSRMLDTFTLAPDERLALLRTVRDGLFEEFGGAHALHVRLGERFRRERTALENLREAAGDDANASLVRAALDRRDAQMREPIEMLRRLAHVHRLATPLVSVAASCVHMTVNRMLRSQARAQELVIYDFLGRLDSGRAARARAATPAHAPTARGPETPASATAPTGAPETTRVAGA